MTTTTPTRRLRVSPYARRLALDREQALEQITGTGPQGRITAADVLAAALRTANGGASSVDLPTAALRAHEPATPATAATALRTTLSAFTATVDLSPLHEIIARTAPAGLALTIEDLALRAAGRALELLDLSGDNALTLEQDGRQVLVAAPGWQSMSRQRAARQAAIEGGHDDASAPALLSVQFLPTGRVAPVMMPLLPGRALRLRLGVHGDHLSALLCSDPDRIADDRAAAVLGHWAALMDLPLALLA